MYYLCSLYHERFKNATPTKPTLLFILSSLHSSETLDKNSCPSTPYHDWDYLLFSQRWPVSGCIEYEDKNPHNTCTLPTNKDSWTVHGIWPTKNGETGPLCCPSSVHFDPDQLTPMMPDLEQHWTNIEANTDADSFWKHEWNKHGTCAVVDPELNSVTNYFQKGLDLNKQYNIADILARGKIVPQKDGYTAAQIAEAMRDVLKKNVAVRCVVDSKTKESLLSEIRICFDKDMNVIDCDATNPVNGTTSEPLTNCSVKKPVMYLGSVPDDDYDDSWDNEIELKMYYREHKNLMKVYRFIKLLLWVTL